MSLASPPGALGWWALCVCLGSLDSQGCVTVGGSWGSEGASAVFSVVKFLGSTTVGRGGAGARVGGTSAAGGMSPRLHCHSLLPVAAGAIAA